MAYIILAPLLPLLETSSGGAAGRIMPLLTFLVIGALVNKQPKKEAYRKIQIKFQAETLAIIAVAMDLGYAFYTCWYPTNKAARIAGVFGLSAKTFVGAVAVLLACASLWSMSWLLHDLKKVFWGPAYLPKLNQRFEQADQDAARLDKNEWLMCALFALGYAIISCDTCPLFKSWQDTDEAAFLYMGREMLRGKIPYVDFFDHKGILMYFIQCVGELLSFPGTYSGVWLIELTGLFITTVFIYKTVRLLTDSKRVGYLVVLVLLFLDRSMYYRGGTLTETYALPCVAMAVYIYLKFFMTAQYRPLEIAALGAGCAAVAFLRVNMAGAWAAFTPLVLFFLLKERQYKDLIRCSLSFIGGFAAVCIPIGLYCFLTGSMGGMIAYYIQFNMTYAKEAGSIVNQILQAVLLMPAVRLVPVLLSFVAYKYGGFSKKAKELFWINMWGLAVCLPLASMSGRMHLYYGIVLIPFFTVPVWLTVESAVNYWKQTNAGGKHTDTGVFGKKPDRVIAAAVCVTVLIISLPKAALAAYYGKPDAVLTYLLNETDESDDVLIVGNACRYYLESGRETDNKFFYQKPPVKTSEDLYNEFIEEVNRHPSDVVLLIEKDDDFFKDIFDPLREEGKYTYEDFGSFAVYRLKDM